MWMCIGLAKMFIQVFHMMLWENANKLFGQPNINTESCQNENTFVEIHIYIYIHTHIHIHTHTYIHVSTPIEILSFSTNALR